MFDPGSGPPPPAWEPIQEVCELCYLLALARQHAWRARLTPGERALLLVHARHLTALLAALAGLADEVVQGAREPRQVAPARELLRYPPSALPLPLAAEALRCCLGPPRWGLRLERCRARLPPRREAMRLGRHPAPRLGPARPLWGPWRRCLLQEGGRRLARRRRLGPSRCQGRVLPAMEVAAWRPLQGRRPPAVAPVALARLVDGPWIGSPALRLDAFTAGTVLETPTHVVEAGAPGPDGVYLSVSFRGASLPAHALELDLSFPAPGAGQPGVLHLCAGGAAACRAPRLVGRGERHADWLRLRSARSLVEPWVRLTFRPPGGGGPGDGAAPAPARGRLAGAAAGFAAAAAAAEAAGPAARPLVARRRRHEQSRSDGEERAGDDQLDSRVAPSRGNAILAVADGRPGTLHDEAIAQIARVMGLREGADGQGARPRIRGYLQALVFGHHPFHSVGERAVRELQTLAAAMDLLEDGSLASVVDALMQRFRALEMALNDGSANELEVVEGIRPTPPSRDEQESARRRRRLQSRLEGLVQGGAVGAGATPLAAVGLPSRRGVAEPALARGSPRSGAAAALGRVELPSPKGAGKRRGRREAARAGAAWPEAGAPLAVLFRTWQEKARAAAESFRPPLDAGPILEELMRGFPGSLGVYVDKFMHSGHRPTRRGRLQRDLQPLPCPDLEASGFTVEEKIGPGDLALLQSRSRVIVMAMYWEAGYRHLKWGDVCGPEPNAAQRSALLGIARRIYSSVAFEPAVAGTLGWSEKLKDRAIAYDGSEVSTPSKITLEHIEGGLPPVGVAASIEAADLAAGSVRAALLDPSLVLLPPAQRRPAPTSARVRATAQEWEQVVSALFARGMVGPIDEGEIATRDGVPLINEAFGVAKVHDAPVRCGDGEERPVLRLIVNLIPANARQHVVAGDTPAMPTMGQLNGLVLAPGEQLLWSGAGRKAFFCVFRAPPAWWPNMALGPPAPRRLAGGSGDGLTRIALRVVGVGGISAVGVTTHLHRNMPRRSASAPRGLPPAAEVVRARRLPAEAQAGGVAMWFIYVDNLEIAEIASSEEAVELKGTIPELLSRASAGYEEAESPGSPGKDVHRAQRVSSLGDLVDGEAGVRRPPLGYVAELASLTLWFLAKRRPSRRLAQILLGRWVRVQCYRRPLAAAFVNAWKWLASGRSGGLITLGVAEDLLIAAALAPLSVADMRLTVDHLATASDASEAADAIVYPQGLSDMGRALGAGGPRALSPACEEGVALISVFSGIDRARQAFEIPGLCAWLGLLRGHDRIAKVIVIKGFPCQGFTVVNVAREGSVDPRSQLVGHMWRLIEGLRRELPEATVDFLGESAPMAEDEVLALNKMFGRVPVSLDAADLGWVRRPLLYWLSWDRLPSFEMSAEMKAAADGARPRACRVRLVTELPPVSDGCRAGPSGWGPPKVLMGFRRGHTVPCMSSSSAKSDPERLEALRRFLVGNSFQCEVVAWWLSHWAVHHSLLLAVPSLRSLHAVCEENLHLVKEAGRAPAAGAGQEARAVYVGRGSRRWGLGPSKWGSPCPVVPGRPAGDAVALFAGEPCHADVLLAELEQRSKGCSRPFLEHQRISAGIWKWKVARQLVWQDQAKHVNVLECEAALRWRARSVSRQMCVFLHLLDSMVNIGDLVMRRSSSQQLNKVPSRAPPMPARVAAAMAIWALERNGALSLGPASFGAARFQPFTPLFSVPCCSEVRAEAPSRDETLVPEASEPSMARATSGSELDRSEPPSSVSRGLSRFVTRTPEGFEGLASEPDEVQDERLLEELHQWSGMRGAPNYVALFEDPGAFSGAATVSGSGKVQWLARESRPDVAGSASLLAAALPTPSVADALALIKVVKFLKASPEQRR
ncbi:unnamed protein product [Prorocentrum cordatum]|uniref:Calmodulin n=1 Tax=Prorocentrum cordatum TaxID=2364126 RepID=A0ABN9Y6Q5_9DINO|nr:unnamed protein product [Polarella glacialis]